ncbi:MAG: NAD(P)H-dependent oxidoreductase subunit E [Lentisphaerae bacterium]|nr:NAD(P)H-dependent oxidoreductase subunit E [Lentisphaerota bacterium]MCP4103381.1 NAD(P)H-dependent oxidoreductase subunit E [Lentisphaerota bacterium]
MSCCDCQGKGQEELNLIEQFPEKREQLEAYIESLDISDDREKNRGFLIQSLHKAQDIFGYLPLSVQLFVADKLKLHLSEVYGVISFYSYFTDKPVGKYKINVCTGTACFVKGAGAILEEFKRYLNIECGETSRDRKFSLGALRCVGACSLAPVVMVNEKVYGKVSTKMVPDIISECK